VCHVDETIPPASDNYDMIIGDVLLKELGIDLLYSLPVASIRWEEVEVPMKPRHLLNESYVMEQIYHQAVDMTSKPLRKAEQRQVQILDTDESTYAEQDLKAFVKTLEHLTVHQQEQLLTVLQTCPVLFSGGLGTADVEPIDFELVPGTKPYHIRQPFSIPVRYQ